jgi:hypothetical protein
MLTCPYCETENTEDTSICRNCWHELQTRSAHVAIVPGPVARQEPRTGIDSPELRLWDFQRVKVSDVRNSDPVPVGFPLGWLLRGPLALLITVSVFATFVFGIYLSWGTIIDFGGKVLGAVLIFFMIFSALNLMLGGRLPGFNLLFDLALQLLSQIASTIFGVIEYLLLRGALRRIINPNNHAFGTDTRQRVPVRNVILNVPATNGVVARDEVIRVQGDFIQGDIHRNDEISVNVSRRVVPDPIHPRENLHEMTFVSGFNHSMNSWIRVKDRV